MSLFLSPKQAFSIDTYEVLNCRASKAVWLKVVEEGPQFTPFLSIYSQMSLIKRVQVKRYRDKNDLTYMGTGVFVRVQSKSILTDNSIDGYIKTREMMNNGTPKTAINCRGYDLQYILKWVKSGYGSRP